jgi:hypothetical protein
MSDAEKMERLAMSLYEAKQTEDAAKKARIAIEEEIAALVVTPENGSKTVPAGAMKVTVKRSLDYKADVTRIMGLGIDEDKLPLKLVPESVELVPKAYEALRSSDPETWAKISQFVVVKPKKTAIELNLA